MNNKEADSYKIISLQSLRGIAFFCIFLSHAGLLRMGPFGVSVFFVLSGFCVYYSASKNIDAGQAESHDVISIRSTLADQIRYLYKRIKILYPLHILMLAASLPLFFKDLSGKTILKVVLNGLLLQSWIPHPDYYFSFNSVSWFLSDCVFLYFLFPLAEKIVKRVSKIGMLLLFGGLTILIIAVLSYLTGLYFPGMINYVTYICPVTRFGDFFVGVLIGKIYTMQKDTENKRCDTKSIYMIVSIIEVLICTLLFLVQQNRGDRLLWWTETLVYFPISICLVLVFARNSGIVTNIINRFTLFRNLGDISGYAFLIHWLVIKYVHCVVGDSYGIISVVVTAIISMLLTVLASCVWKYLRIKNKVK